MAVFKWNGIEKILSEEKGLKRGVMYVVNNGKTDEIRIFEGRKKKELRNELILSCQMLIRLRYIIPFVK